MLVRHLVFKFFLYKNLSTSLWASSKIHTAALCHNGKNFTDKFPYPRITFRSTVSVVVFWFRKIFICESSGVLRSSYLGGS